ncbi:hypothetical protein [Laceyella putida]|uniref:Macro domain-containing protein n=1 Tax=Laceyella putida TaxID=110101 RepID=A0ABW2RMA2_9BACL
MSWLLLISNCTVIGHQCNCLGVMDTEIAKRICDLYPEVYEADQNYPIPFGEKRLGHLSCAWVKDKYVGSRLVYNLYGQHRYGRKGNYTVVRKLEQALEEMMKKIESVEDLCGEEWIKVGLPYGMGAEFVSGDWNEIMHVIEKVSNQFYRDIYLYQLQ